MIEEIIACDKARIPVVWLSTHEELRAEVQLFEYAAINDGTLWVWSLTSDKGHPG